MTEWPNMTLGEICAEGGGFIRTGPFGSQLHQSDYVDDPGGIPVVMPKDMANEVLGEELTCFAELVGRDFPSEIRAAVEGKAEAD